MGLDGTVALVTGGSRGIGQGIARRLLAAGARVVVAARTTADLEETVRQLSPLGEIVGVRCDVSDVTSVTSLVNNVLAAHGTIDVLTCSHGVLNTGQSVLDCPVSVWDHTIAVNLRGTFLCGQAAARAMVERGTRGRIINISSTAALASGTNEAAYDASKGGVHSLTRAMANDLGPYGITVNAIAPGWVRTDMIPPHLLTDEVAHNCNPVGRFGEPEDVGDAVVWLADPATSYVTGTTIVIDGGHHAAMGKLAVVTDAPSSAA